MSDILLNTAHCGGQKKNLQQTDQLKALLGNSLPTALGKGWDVEQPDPWPRAGLLQRAQVLARCGSPHLL